MTHQKIFLLCLLFLNICIPYNAWNKVPWLRSSLQILPISKSTNFRHYGNFNSSSTLPDAKLIYLTASSTPSSGGTTQSITANDQLSYLQLMTAGALSRTISQVLLHPAYTYKTLLQLKDKDQVAKIKLSLSRLLQGADAQFLLSLPHGAFYFMVIDNVKAMLGKVIPKRFEFLADFSSSAISTIICSVISTPQMVITDRLMAGIYPTFPAALSAIMKTDGVKGFYRGWWPALAQKIPSYGLTWMFFQQLKKGYEVIFHRKPTHEMNFFLGAAAAAGSVTVMIPMDTIKTRLVIQTCEKGGYKGVTDCFLRMLKEEGIGSLYRSLPPRLVSVVPMIAIQFGVYEFLKTQFIHRNVQQRLARANRSIRTGAIKAVKKTASRVNQFRKSNLPTRTPFSSSSSFS